MNDIPMPLFPWWGNALISVFFLIISVVVHEAAHLKKIREYYPAAERPVFWRDGWRFGMRVSWPEYALTTEQEYEVLLFGIIIGIFPVLIVMFFTGAEWGLVTIGAYMVGCWSDMRSIWRLKT